MSLNELGKVLAIIGVFIISSRWAFWLSCRLGARKCPQCGSKWRTELRGEWGGEDWKCHACGHAWETPYDG